MRRISDMYALSAFYFVKDSNDFYVRVVCPWSCTHIMKDLEGSWWILKDFVGLWRVLDLEELSNWNWFLKKVCDNLTEWVTVLDLERHAPLKMFMSSSIYKQSLGHLPFSKKNFKKKTENAPQGAMGGGGVKFFLPKFLLFFFRSPCKIWEPYDNPFWKNSDGGRKRKRKKEREKKRKSQWL